MTDRDEIARLLSAAKLLLGSARNCVAIHHGHDIEANGLPPWLADAAADIARADALLSREAAPASAEGSRTIDIVFDGPRAGHEAGRFVEVQCEGKSIRLGEWIERDDGCWALRFQANGRERQLLAQLDTAVETAERLVIDGSTAFLKGFEVCREEIERAIANKVMDLDETMSRTEVDVALSESGRTAILNHLLAKRSGIRILVFVIRSLQPPATESGQATTANESCHCFHSARPTKEFRRPAHCAHRLSAVCRATESGQAKGKQG